MASSDGESEAREAGPAAWPLSCGSEGRSQELLLGRLVLKGSLPLSSLPVFPSSPPPSHSSSFFGGIFFLKTVSCFQLPSRGWKHDKSKPD